MYFNYGEYSLFLNCNCSARILIIKINLESDMLIKIFEFVMSE